jgi:3-methylcrotonyl-CoA carboxylase alpha subunit
MQGMKRVLIANRGEIAVRIIKTLKSLGISTVAVYHSDEKSATHVKEAQHAVSLGRESLRNTYLNIPRLIQIAQENSCDAIHPGYGFLSENYEFARACEENKITFIGPKSEVIRLMGLKSEAKTIAVKAGVPVLESVVYQSIQQFDKLNFNFPVLIKAVAGGGGKGMKIVNRRDDFEVLVKSAKREAEQYFGDDRVIIEPYLDNARHIEVQIVGDQHDNIIHLFERECSLQRNHQKIIEEAPASSLSDSLRSEIHQAAVNFARELNYSSLGTVEFLVSKNKFYFLEMNTRIQVEHPVTEMITGIDLVKEQIFIADGRKLSEEIKNAQFEGHAIEARICAENPYENFRASSGRVSFVHFPEEVRVDTFIHSDTLVTPHFDSMLGKMILYGKDRTEAIDKLARAIKSTVIHGVDTNLNYLFQIVKDDNFVRNQISTRYLENTLPEKINNYKENISRVPGRIIALAFVYNNFIKPAESPKNIWQSNFSNYFVRDVSVSVNGENFLFRINNKHAVFIEGQAVNYQVFSNDKTSIELFEDGSKFKIFYSENKDKPYDNYELEGFVFKVSSPSVLRMCGEFVKKNRIKNKNTVNQIVSPLFGKIIAINVKEKDRVKKGDVLLTIESMKTENNIVSPTEGIVKSILVSTGIQVQENNELITLNPVG